MVQAEGKRLPVRLITFGEDVVVVEDDDLAPLLKIMRKNARAMIAR